MLRESCSWGEVSSALLFQNKGRRKEKGEEAEGTGSIRGRDERKERLAEVKIMASKSLLCD